MTMITQKFLTQELEIPLASQVNGWNLMESKGNSYAESLEQLWSVLN